MHNKTAHLLINIKIIIFRAMGIKINQILGFSGQMRDLLMRVFFFYSSLSLFLEQKNTRPSNKTWKKCNMSKGYYLASLLHVLIRFFYGDVQDSPYFFIFYSCFLIMRECLWVILINWINMFFNYCLIFFLSISKLETSTFPTYYGL